VRKEALLSSQIEGTQSSITDVFTYERYKVSSTPVYDVEEVTNYINAMNFAINKMEIENFPVCNRLLLETHNILMSGIRGGDKQPGQFRKSQNWIGGIRPGKATYVPPPAEYVEDLMSDLEKFINIKGRELPDLIMIALVHAQFESIHPFLDGNGRLGRLMITLLLCERKILQSPILYMSYYFKVRRQEYYTKLQNIRNIQDGWLDWVEFFLCGVVEAAEEAFQKALELNDLIEQDIKLLTSKRAVYEVPRRIYKVMKAKPIVSLPDLSKILGVTLHTVNRGMKFLEDHEIVEEVTGKKSNRLYGYKKYISLLSD
jgi:Fic family protein